MPDTKNSDFADSTTTISASTGSGGIIDNTLSAKNTVNIGTDTTIETTAKFNMKETKDASGFSLGLEEKLTHEFSSIAEMKLRNAAELEVGTKDIKFSNEAEAGVKIGTDDFYEEYSAKAGTGLSLKDGLEANFGGTHTQKAGLYEQSKSENVGVGFDGEKFSAKYSQEDSVKVGNDQYSEEAYTKNSVGVGSDGSLEASSTVGSKVKAGGVETGVEHTSSGSHSEGEDGVTDSHTEKTQVSSSVEVGKGVKVKNTSGIENTEKVSENDESITEESSTQFTSSTRIEVDAEKAGPGAVVAASVFNAQMAVTEGIISEATKMSSKTETEKEQPEEANDEQQASEEDAQIEAEAQAQQEHEEQLQAEADAAAEEDQSTDAEVQAAAEEQAQEQQMADEEIEAQAEAEAEAQAQAEAEAQAQAEAEESYDYDYGYGY